MTYLEYMQDRMTPISLFAVGMCGAFMARDPLGALIAAWLAISFFGCIFSALWLLGTVVRRKPRRDLTRLR